MQLTSFIDLALKKNYLSKQRLDVSAVAGNHWLKVGRESPFCSLGLVACHAKSCLVGYHTGTLTLWRLHSVVSTHPRSSGRCLTARQKVETKHWSEV